MADKGRHYIYLDGVGFEPFAQGYFLHDSFFEELDQEEIKGGEVEAEVNVTRTGEIFHLAFKLEGRVKVICDRCLDLVELPVSVEESIDAYYSDEDVSNDEDTVVLPTSEDGMDVSWLIYELILTSLPTKRVHEEGACNSEMQELIDRYDGGEGGGESDARWDALKNIRNND